MDPWTIVVALACVVLGAPDVLRLLLEFAGKSPVVDIAICTFVMTMVTAHLLGVALLARFVRKAPRDQASTAGGGETPRRPRAPATDLLCKLTLVVSVGVAFLVTACLVVVPGGGLASSAQLVFDFAGESPVATAIVIGAAGSLPFIMPLLHVLRQARNAGGGGAPATERIAGMTRPAACLATGLSLIFLCFAKPAGLDALPLFRCFTAAVVGTVLLARFSRSAARAGAVPGPATGAERFGFGKLRQNGSRVTLVCIAFAGALSVLQYAYASPAYKSDGGKHVWSV